MRATIRVGVSTCGLAAGAEAVCSAIETYLHRRQHLLRPGLMV